MLLNQDTAISTRHILLVPYEPHHVQEYHAWMQRADLQELTASEPLSLDEEYAMQASWRQDPDKLTFIVCLPFTESTDHVRAGVDDTPDQMIGDINLYVSDDPDVDPSTSASPSGIVAEIEIMIAKPGATGQGRGRAATLAFLRYVYENQGQICGAFASGKGLREAVDAPRQFKYLRVKIGEKNAPSIGLFQSLGFEGRKEPNVFGEVELRLPVGLEEALKGWENQWPGAVSQVDFARYEREAGAENAEGEEDEDGDGDEEMDG